MGLTREIVARIQVNFCNISIQTSVRCHQSAGALVRGSSCPCLFTVLEIHETCHSVTFNFMEKNCSISRKCILTNMTRALPILIIFGKKISKNLFFFIKSNMTERHAEQWTRGVVDQRRSGKLPKHHLKRDSLCGNQLSFFKCLTNILTEVLFEKSLKLIFANILNH